MPKNPIIEVIEGTYAEMTPTFKKIATYILANIDYLPYETAETISQKVVVSGVTVGRFFRYLGYKNIEEIKAVLRDSEVKPWLVTDRYEAHQQQNQSLESKLQLEIEAIQYAHALADTLSFKHMVKRIAHADSIYIIGLQSLRGIMNHFASLLEYMRPNVFYADGASGAFLETFNHEENDSYMMLCDLRAYAKITPKLCQAAMEHQMKFGLITDVYCSWARELQGDVLMLKTETGQFWDSITPIMSLMNLLLTNVALELGEGMKERLDKNRKLQAYFGQFDI